MKRIICFLIAAMFIFISAVSVSATDVSNVGRYDTMIDGVSIYPEFWDSNHVSVVIINEYNRAIATRSTLKKGYGYFDYGETADEYAHLFATKVLLDSNGNSFQNICIYQVFILPDVLGIMENDCNFIIVTTASIAKDEAYTVRDGIARAWENAGSLHSEWGMPTDNQRWIERDGKMYCYQTFDRGYAIMAEDLANYADWYSYADGNVAPTGGSLDYDWGIPEGAFSSDKITYAEYQEPLSPQDEIAFQSPDKDDSESAIKTENNITSDDAAVTEDETAETAADTSEAEDTAEVGETAAEDNTKPTAKNDAVEISTTSFLGLTVGSVPFWSVVIGVPLLLAGTAVVVVILIRRKNKTNN